MILLILMNTLQRPLREASIVTWEATQSQDQSYAEDSKSCVRRGLHILRNHVYRIIGKLMVYLGLYIRMAQFHFHSFFIATGLDSSFCCVEFRPLLSWRCHRRSYAWTWKHRSIGKRHLSSTYCKRNNTQKLQGKLLENIMVNSYFFSTVDTIRR